MKELQLSQYKFSEMENVCLQLREDLSSIGFLSGEIDRLTAVINERDRELQQWKAKYSEYSKLHATYFFLMKDQGALVPLRGVVRRDRESEAAPEPPRAGGPDSAEDELQLVY